MKSKYGFLYNGYRLNQAFYWEFIIIYRKIVLIFIQVFLSILGKAYQAYITFAYLLICIVVSNQKQPYQKGYLNNLDILSLFSSSVTVYCGLFYITDASFKDQQEDEMNNNSKLFLFSMILMSHSVFGIYWIYHFSMEMRYYIRSKTPKLYTMLFLRCKKERLQKEIKIDEYKAQIEPFLTSYDKILEYLQQRHQMYSEGFAPTEDMNLKQQLISLHTFVQTVEKSIHLSKSAQIMKSFEQVVQSKNSIKKRVKLRPAESDLSMKKQDNGPTDLIMIDEEFFNDSYDQPQGLQITTPINQSQDLFEKRRPTKSLAMTNIMEDSFWKKTNGMSQIENGGIVADCCQTDDEMEERKSSILPAKQNQQFAIGQPSLRSVDQSLMEGIKERKLSKFQSKKQKLKQQKKRQKHVLEEMEKGKISLRRQQNKVPQEQAEELDVEFDEEMM